MTALRANSRLPAILWFVAAALAAAAVGIRLFRGRDVNWGLGAAALFCVGMGVSTWVRSRSAPASP